MFTCDGYKQIAFYKMVLRFSSSVSLRLTACMAMCLCATASGHMNVYYFMWTISKCFSSAVVIGVAAVFSSAGIEIYTKE